MGEYASEISLTRQEK